MPNGTEKSVSIKAMTLDTKIHVDEELVGTDAASVRLKKDDNHAITVKKGWMRNYNQEYKYSCSK